MIANLGSADRIIRLVVGIVLLVAPFASSAAMFETTLATVISVGIGLVLIGTAAMRFCPLYRITGIRTCKT